MLYTLMRRDITWKLTLTMVIVGAIGGATNTKFSIVLLNGYIFLAVWAKPNQRATLFEATLPIMARDLFLARTLSLLAMVLLPVGAACASVLVTQGLAGWNETLRLVALGAMLALAIVLAISGRIEQLSSSVWVLPAIAPVLVGAGVLVVMQPGYAVAISVLSTAAGLFWFWRAWESVPETFQIAPLTVEAAPEASTEVSAAGGNVFGHRLPAWTVIRSITGWRNVVWLCILGVQAFAGSWIVGCFFAVSYVASCMSRMSWLFTLPIRRRALLAYTLTPIAAIMLIGFVGAALGSFDTPVHIGAGDTFRTYSQRGEGTPSVQVPLEYWRWSPNGAPPEIRAPWGESHVPPTITVLGLAFYNPYSVGQRRTNGFLEWQLGNATEAILGRRFTLSEYDAGRLAASHLSEEGWIPVTRQLRYLILEGTVMLSFLLLIVCASELAISYRVYRLGRIWRYTLISALFLIPTGFFVAPTFSANTRGSNGGAMALVRAGVLWLWAALPQGLVSIAAFSAIVLVALCWLAVRMFDDVEVLTVTPKSPL